MKYDIENIIEEYELLGIRQQLEYDRFYLYAIITHSTAIEGSTVTEIENRLLFDEGIGANKPMIEQLMNLDLKAAYGQGLACAKKHTSYTVALLCRLAALVMKNTGSDYKAISGDFSSAKGELRRINVSAGRGGKSYLAWQKVEDRLKEFCRWLNGERKNFKKYEVRKIYELSFEAHYRIVTIHPWADGNGRMNRLIMNMIQFEAGLIPSIVKKERRTAYITALSKSQDEENSAKFLSFMLKQHCENLLKQIKEYKASVEEHDAYKKTVGRKVKGGQKSKGGQNAKGGQNGWSETAKKIYYLIKDHPYITRRQLSEETGINPSAVQKHINKLKEQKMIRRAGGAKGGYWEIIGKMK